MCSPLTLMSNWARVRRRVWALDSFWLCDVGRFKRIFVLCHSCILLWISRLLVFNVLRLCVDDFVSGFFYSLALVVVHCCCRCSFSCILSPLDSLLCDLVNSPRATKYGRVRNHEHLHYIQYIHNTQHLFILCLVIAIDLCGSHTAIASSAWSSSLLPQYLFVSFLFSHRLVLCSMVVFFQTQHIHFALAANHGSC